ncbi:hypothetical protein SBD_3617 [Streptomyces bottropensis ATCC 25435]|uniref:Uncharacterized protein n=1 Tax=Streptomyces bottropensis ATCC 25435 TaxID=1054862 RepID=M3FLX2_9ACTN|nr:hypothetical protein SBD_3617 [Streptomyces bottropensis ATCC 25435]
MLLDRWYPIRDEPATPRVPDRPLPPARARPGGSHRPDAPARARCGRPGTATSSRLWPRVPSRGAGDRARTPRTRGRTRLTPTTPSPVRRIIEALRQPMDTHPAPSYCRATLTRPGSETLRCRSA